MRICAFAGLAGSLLLLGSGCKKEAPQSAQTIEGGFEQLRAALVKASPEVQSNLYNGVSYNLRYDRYVEALVYLDRIVSDPGLSEPQKKAVNQVIELVKAKVQGPNASQSK